MSEKINLCGLSRSEMEQVMVDSGHKPFRGRQVYKWIYKKRVFDFDRMSDLKKEVRAELHERLCVRLPEIVDRQKSDDGTEKFLFELEDKNVIETVLIPDDNSGRMTLCISSQVGCQLACTFCATGYLGYKRDLTVGEIIAQALRMREIYGDEAFDNVVFMGMGEPLLNYDRVMTAVDIMTDSVGLMVGAKRITISTVGIAPAIRKLAESGSKVNLALSLNAPNDKLRRELMPITKAYPLDKVMSAIREWTAVRTRRVSVDLERPEEEDVDRFAQILYPRAPAVTVRKSRGSDIAAACGQLAGRKGYSCANR
jgi:23S rRNA (adenine2503-C2)-methyltransferase